MAILKNPCFPVSFWAGKNHLFGSKKNLGNLCIEHFMKVRHIYDPTTTFPLWRSSKRRGDLSWVSKPFVPTEKMLSKPNDDSPFNLRPNYRQCKRSSRCGSRFVFRDSAMAARPATSAATPPEALNVEELELPWIFLTLENQNGRPCSFFGDLCKCIKLLGSEFL